MPDKFIKNSANTSSFNQKEEASIDHEKKNRVEADRFITSHDMQERIEIATEFFVLKEHVAQNTKKINELKSNP